jgi:hypothetical protein
LKAGESRTRRANPASGLLEDLADTAGTDGAAAFADGEAHGLLHGDRGDQLDVRPMLSPGITISTPFGRVTLPVTSVVRK